MVKVWYFGLDVTRTAHWTNGWFKLGTLFVSNITFRAKHELTSKVAFDLSQKPGPKARPFETSLRLSRPISAYPRHRSGYLHTPGTGQGTNRLLELVRVPAYPWYWSGYLQGICLLLALVRVPAYPWHWSGYLQGICLLLALVRVPTGYLLTPGTGQGTYRVSAYSWHWSGYLQGTCLPLALVRVPTGYLLIPDTGQGTSIPLALVRVPAYPWHWSGYLLTPGTGQGTNRVSAYFWHCSGYQHAPGTSQGTCLLLALVRVPTDPWNWSGYLHTPGTGQGTEGFFSNRRGYRSQNLLICSESRQKSAILKKHLSLEQNFATESRR